MPKILANLQDIAKNKQDSINDWFLDKYKKHKSFIYNSVDIRYSGFKITPVDTNIFPAGFNNLSKEAVERAIIEMKESLGNDIEKIIVITEFHTRNLRYLENVNIIKRIFTEAGYQVKCASFAEDFDTPLELVDAADNSITIYPVERSDDKLHIGDFYPDLIINNNDLTAGVPEILVDIGQEINPPLNMGWHLRKKYNHFDSYNFLASEFAKEFNFDPFLISTELGFCKKVNFKERKGIECIAIATEKTLSRIKEKYQELGIDSEPYVYIKANRGTYGMGIMSVKNAEEVLNLNKKSRNKMNIIKSNTPNAEILIQEGIETIDSYNNSPAEPFIYLMNGKAMGTILRTNPNRDSKNNLNSAGAEFYPADSLKEFQDKIPAYNIIARLAALASSIEEN